MCLYVGWGGGGVIKTRDASPSHRIVSDPGLELALDIFPGKNRRSKGVRGQGVELERTGKGEQRMVPTTRC